MDIVYRAIRKPVEKSKNKKYHEFRRRQNRIINAEEDFNKNNKLLIRGILNDNILIPFEFVKEIMSHGIKLNHEYGGITFNWDYDDAKYALSQLGYDIKYPDKINFTNKNEYYIKCNEEIQLILNKLIK